MNDSAKKLLGQVALITGGTSGIGKSTALLFAREGASVLITGRRADAGENVVAEIASCGGQAAYTLADHTKLEDCTRVLEFAKEKFGRVDILFNNAGVVIGGSAEQTTESQWAATFELNVTATWRMSKLLIPQMRSQGGGIIVNNASDWGLIGAKGAVAYCASKGAVIQLTRAMALDHARDNIRINVVCPGDTLVEKWATTGYFKNDEALSTEDVVAAGARLPLGRVARPDEISKAVLFLASADSSFATGSVLVVDGGNTAR